LGSNLRGIAVQFNPRLAAGLRRQFAQDFAPPDAVPEWRWAPKAFAVLVPTGHFVPAARQSRTWQPNNLLDLSFTLYLLGVGLILGAVFQVFG
jgi:hypothetical protein